MPQQAICFIIGHSLRKTPNYILTILGHTQAMIRQKDVKPWNLDESFICDYAHLGRFLRRDKASSVRLFIGISYSLFSQSFELVN